MATVCPTYTLTMNNCTVTTNLDECSFKSLTIAVIDPERPADAKITASITGDVIFTDLDPETTNDCENTTFSVSAKFVYVPGCGNSCSQPESIGISRVDNESV